jgi:predicted transcriptional regulator
MVADEDKVFKALADPSRRKLLDRLFEKNGQSLNELCALHLDLLEDANLVVTQKRGREKLHYINPVPIQQIYSRWIGKFEQQRLHALDNLKQALEEKENDG